MVDQDPSNDGTITTTTTAADPQVNGDAPSNGDVENGAMNGTTKKPKKMEALEIDANESFGDDDDKEEEHLLGTEDGEDTTKQQHNKKEPCYAICCVPAQKVGNMRIFLPTIFDKSGWGIAGPHWFGPICVLGIIALASHYFMGIAMRRIGIGTTIVCGLFTVACTYNLVNVAYRDPGVVQLQANAQRPQDSDEDQRLQFRWCDRCQVFQPVDGAHCPDCNVCVAGFDHHCVWMGTCIGKNNFKEFVKFNITWLLYLIYCITWVSILGPLIFHKSHHHESHDSSSEDVSSMDTDDSITNTTMDNSTRHYLF